MLLPEIGINLHYYEGVNVSKNTYKLTDYTERISKAIEKIDVENWNRSAELIYEVWKNNGNVYLAGNGGSASTVNHFLVDWTKGLSHVCGKALKAHSLVSDLPTITAISNDIDYEKVFSEQLSYFANRGDLLLTVSGSGNSRNLIDLVITAQSLDLKTIALTGFDGGRLGELVDINANVHFDNMQIVEDVHSMFGHFVLEFIHTQQTSGL